jgi:capsular polysaccharide biosynthesis protein
MNLRDYLLILRRRKWIGILVLAATMITVALLTTVAPQLYEARSTIFIGPQSIGVSDPSGAVTQTGLSIAERLTKTYARIIQSRPVAAKAVEDDELGVGPEYLLGRMTVTPIQDTTLIELRFRDANPVLAAAMANATSDAFVEIAEGLTPSGSGSSNAQPIVPVTVIEDAATPTVPVSPNASRNLALAAVLGIVIGTGLMFAAEYLDVAVRGPDDVERLVQLPVLALIPRVSRDDIVVRRGAARAAKVRAS